MTSDLRAAAERVIRSSGGDESLFAIYCTTLATDALRKHAADCGALAEHILASQPADGEEAITEEWLARVGFVCEGGGYAINFRDEREYHQVTLHDLGPTIKGLWRFSGCVHIKQHGVNEIGMNIRTRSDVRRLCGVLGIPLREGKDNG